MSSTQPLLTIGEPLADTIQANLNEHWKLYLGSGILMVLLGVAAILLPIISTLEIEMLIGWLLILGGVFRSLTVLKRRHVAGFGMSLLSGILSICLGLILVGRPLQGMLTLTILLTVFFVIEGVSAVLVALEERRQRHPWGWTLFNGIIDGLLACLIWQGWPNDATWIIGLYVGINMIFLGFPLILLALAARRAQTRSA
jgi:uncharacterized membrane protein HdeD (DUF308 family)